MKSIRRRSGGGQSKFRRTRRRVRATLTVGIVTAIIALVAVFKSSDWQTGASAEQIAEATGVLTAPQVFYDFGRVSMSGGKITHRFPLRNDSMAPALIEQIFTSCMCTEASLLIGGKTLGPFGMQGHAHTPRINQILDPGQEAVVEVVFDPKAHGPAGLGPNKHEVFLRLSEKHVLQLKFIANITP